MFPVKQEDDQVASLIKSLQRGIDNGWFEAVETGKRGMMQELTTLCAGWMSTVRVVQGGSCSGG